MTAMEIAVVIVAVLVAIAIIALGLYWWRHRTLRSRFGPEYDRVAADRGSRVAADRELYARERKHRNLQLRPLDPRDRERYAAAWRKIQVRFVDEPDSTIGDADELLTRLVADRGYPTANYEEQLDQLSVDHARTLSRYRDAHSVYERHQRGEATTEELRRALVHYRALFADLLGEEPVEPAGRDNERESPRSGKIRR